MRKGYETYKGGFAEVDRILNLRPGASKERLTKIAQRRHSSRRRLAGRVRRYPDASIWDTGRGPSLGGSIPARILAGMKLWCAQAGGSKSPRDTGTVAEHRRCPVEARHQAALRGSEQADHRSGTDVAPVCSVIAM